MAEPDPTELGLCDAFLRQARLHPHAPAVVSDNETLTYRDLDRLSLRGAHRLAEAGVAAGDIIGILLDRSPAYIVTILAILRAGAAYLPLDPTSPRPWRDTLLRTTATTVLVANDPQSDPHHVIAYRDLLDGPSPPTAELPATGPRHLAYTMFTSGSTGTPKAIAIPQRAITSLVLDQNYTDLQPGDSVLAHSPVAFDASTFEIWGPLLTGAHIAVAPPGIHTPRMLADFVHRHHVTTMFLTTALFHLAVDTGLTGFSPLRRLLFGGDLVSPAHLRRAQRQLPQVQLRAVYGPTEATVFATSFHADQDADITNSVPIGRALRRVQAHVLDDNLQPVHGGDSGELYLAGAGLAWGYIGAPDLTADRFLPNPFSTTSGARMYRTGDRARRRGDGQLDFLGRVDTEVKIRGHRINPTAVEATLLRHHDVASAYVTTEINQTRGRFVVAHVARRANATLDEHQLRQHMGSLVPPHLRPDVYLFRDDLELTANGKLNRRRLLDSAAPSTPQPDTNAEYRVTVNTDGQHAIWPAQHDIPSGWTALPTRGTRQACLNDVRARWHDITPSPL